MLLSAPRSTLLMVDIQDNLAPVMSNPRNLYRNCALLLQGAAKLGVPVTVSEQYPKGLGHSVGELKALVSPDSILEKIHFSCAEEVHFQDRIIDPARPQLVIFGIEAHICVLQSALGFLQKGLDVHVVADACDSRDPANRAAAMDRMRAHGATIVTTEMVLFEWLHRAGTPQFKDISRLVK